jgi:hypothetical protein
MKSKWLIAFTVVLAVILGLTMAMVGCKTTTAETAAALIHITIENLNMFHNAGLGILSQYSENLNFRNVNFTFKRAHYSEPDLLMLGVIEKNAHLPKLEFLCNGSED